MKRMLCIMLMFLLLAGCANNEEMEMNTETNIMVETCSTEQEAFKNEYVELETDAELELEIQEDNVYTYTELNKTMYAKQSVNVRDLPCADGNKLGELSTNQEVTVKGQCNETSWYQIQYNDQLAYVNHEYLVDEKLSESKVSTPVPEEYKYYYDTDRDGLVSDAEIDAFDRRFYAEEPTMDNTRVILKTGYNQVLSLVNSYSGETYYAVMVKAEDDYSYGMKLLDRFLLDMGLRALSNGGGSIDEERVIASCDNLVPIQCTIHYNVHGEPTGWECGWPNIAEEIYGYTAFEVAMACSGVGTEHLTFVEKPEGGHLSNCDCGGGYEVVTSFEQIKAILGIQ